MSGPVLLIGFDAMDATRVGILLARGRLPNLAALRAGGASGTVVQRPDLMRTMVWPAFQTGMPVHERANPSGRAWVPERMRFEWGPEDARIEPFWEQLDRDRRVIIADVPFVGRPGPSFHGTLLSGWQSIPDRIQLAHPDSLAAEVASRFGPRLQTQERRGPQTVASLLALHREMVAATEQMGEIAAWLAARPFDLMALVIGTTHRSRHYL